MGLMPWAWVTTALSSGDAEVTASFAVLHWVKVKKTSLCVQVCMHLIAASFFISDHSVKWKIALLV